MKCRRGNLSGQNGHTLLQLEDQGQHQQPQTVLAEVPLIYVIETVPHLFALHPLAPSALRRWELGVVLYTCKSLPWRSGGRSTKGSRSFSEAFEFVATWATLRVCLIKQQINNQERGG